MRRVLLLGPGGQLGWDIRRLAAERSGLEVTPLGREELDVSEVGAIGRVLGDRGFDVLINTTSFHRTDEVESQADRAFVVNAHAVGEMAKVCAREGARFVHLSTDYVFDGLAQRPYRETDPTGPLNVYGASKRMGEVLAQAVHEDVLIFRVASLFGVAGSSGKGGNFVETMIRAGREKGELRVVADQVMSPTGSADVAGWILAAVEHDLPAGTYHAVNSGQASWYAFAEEIVKRAGVAARVEPIAAAAYPVQAARPAYSVLDNGRLEERLGTIPHWTEALQQYLVEKGHGVG